MKYVWIFKTMEKYIHSFNFIQKYSNIIQLLNQNCVHTKYLSFLNIFTLKLIRYEKSTSCVSNKKIKN